jgi:hypothetical protein
VPPVTAGSSPAVSTPTTASPASLDGHEAAGGVHPAQRHLEQPGGAVVVTETAASSSAFRLTAVARLI